MIRTDTLLDLTWLINSRIESLGGEITQAEQEIYDLFNLYAKGQPVKSKEKYDVIIVLSCEVYNKQVFTAVDTYLPHVVNPEPIQENFNKELKHHPALDSLYRYLIQTLNLRHQFLKNKSVLLITDQIELQKLADLYTEYNFKELSVAIETIREIFSQASCDLDIICTHKGYAKQIQRVKRRVRRNRRAYYGTESMGTGGNTS